MITRAKLREEMKQKLKSIVYREVIRIDSTLAVVTIHLQDCMQLGDDASMILTVYVPTTKRTFSFKLTETDVRECLEKALSSDGKLSWDEMLNEKALSELPKRLIMRLMRNQPIFIFSRRHIVEKGTLIDKRLVRSEDEIFILSTFRSPHDFVFSTYQPSKRLHMRAKLTLPKLTEWINETKRDEENHQDSQISMLHPKRQSDLIEWLVKRVLIRKKPFDDNMMILLQFEAEEERVLNLVIKVQAQWRRLQSFRRAKEETLHQYEKIFDRENQIFAYRNMLTDKRQREKPKLLGEDDLGDPVDEWRTEETYDPTTGQTILYYANYATGQSSWLSEEEAARLVQRRFRSKHESDLLGEKISFADVVKAMQFINGARTKFEQDPTKLSNIVNFALLTHCLDLNFDAARPVYEQAMKLSPNHPLISRVYAIFLLASRQIPHNVTFQTACQLLHDADVADRSQSMIQSAAEIYFRWAVLVDARNPLTLLNYALLHQCIYKDYDHAEKLYRAALALDPTNTLVVENYRRFNDERYPGGAYEGHGPPFSVVRRSKVAEEHMDWGEWRKMTDPSCPRKGFEIFWFNRFTKVTRFAEPDWSVVWENRLRRSKWIDGKTTAWQEFYDERTKSSFFYNTYTQQYTSSQKKSFS
jgi:tetratricopeptide (TPR) repeat protein